MCMRVHAHACMLHACIYIYVCMYVCTYVRMYVCMYVRMYVGMYACIYACMCACICVRMHAQPAVAAASAARELSGAKVVCDAGTYNSAPRAVETHIQGHTYKDKHIRTHIQGHTCKDAGSDEGCEAKRPAELASAASMSM